MKKLLLLFTLMPFLASSQIITRIAGTGVAGYSGDGGPATAAQIENPSGLARDAAGNYYISDCNNNVIRKVTPGGIITTVVGNGVAGYGGDGGPATAAQINRPIKIIFDATGNMYIGELYGDRVRKVTPAGIITTFAGGGTGGDGGPATSASLDAPVCMAIDNAGNMYIGEYTGARVRKVTPAGIISTYAGTGISGYGGDGGPATAARFNGLFDIALDATGNLYVADAANNRVRKVNPSGIISTWAGTGVAGFSGDGGLASAAKLKNPAGLEIDAAGNIYVSDQMNQRLRKVTPAGIINTIAGDGVYGSYGDGGPATAAALSNTNETLAMPDGSIMVCDDLNHKIRLILPDCPVITTTGPYNDTINSGDTTSFYVTTTATSPSYQWQILTSTGYVNLTGVAPYSGVNTATLTISGALTTLDSTYFRCIITIPGGCPGDTSDPAILRVGNNCPEITTSAPLNDTIDVGDTTIFYITTTATAPAFQWQKLTSTGYVNLFNSALYSGVTNDTLKVTGAPPTLDSTYFRCMVYVSEGCSGDSSDAAILRVWKGGGHVGVGNTGSQALGLKVFPNPADDKLFVGIANTKDVIEVSVLDAVGRIMTTAGGTGNVQMHIGSLLPGMYLVRVKAGDQYIYRQLIKK